MKQTCKHFRFQMPREYADELRDADPEPCPVCDVLPHRRKLPCPSSTARVTLAGGRVARWETREDGTPHLVQDPEQSLVE